MPDIEELEAPLTIVEKMELADKVYGVGFNSKNLHRNTGEPLDREATAILAGVIELLLDPKINYSETGRKARDLIKASLLSQRTNE